jgi:hypothetical protein
MHQQHGADWCSAHSSQTPQLNLPDHIKQEEVMKNVKVLPITMFALLLCATLVPGVRASESDKRTIVTFSDSVEIPGQVLEPGTYVFKLLDSPSNRNIVQVWNGDEDQLLATIQTISDYKPHVDDKSVFYLGPLSGDPNLALQSWFYPGETSGRRFVYRQYPTNDQTTRPNRAR